MGRDDAPPFARGETFNNGGVIDLVNLGGVNLEGKEYGFEPDSYDSQTAFPGVSDPSGRPIRVKVVRNRSGVNLKGARLAHFEAGSTIANPYETGVDGYCYQLSDRPAGVIDEYLPPAGVPPNDLFYLVIDGPSRVTQGATTGSTLAVGNRLVPATYGATAGDDLAGRVILQDLTGATTPLAENINHCLGFAATVAASTAPTVLVNAVIDITW